MSDNWYFTLEQVEQSPSRRDGMIPSRELEIISSMWNSMRNLGSLIGVYITNIFNVHFRSTFINATAQVIFLRYYTQHSLLNIDKMSTSCIFLACKIDDNKKSIKDVITAGLKHFFPLKKFSSQEYLSIQDSVLRMELDLLKTLSFDLVFEHPWSYVIEYGNMLKPELDRIEREMNEKENSEKKEEQKNGIENLPEQKEFKKEVEIKNSLFNSVRQDAVYLVNDSFGTKLPLLYTPDKIAAAFMIFSGKMNNVEVSEWYNQLHIDKVECAIIQYIVMKYYSETNTRVYRFQLEIMSVLRTNNIKIPFVDPPPNNNDFPPQVVIPVIANNVNTIPPLRMTQNPYQQQNQQQNQPRQHQHQHHQLQPPNINCIYLISIFIL